MRKAIILVGATLLLALPAAATEKRIHKTLALSPTGSVSIDTHNGSISVTTWNQATVDVQARIEPGDFASDDDVNRTDVRVTGSEGSVRVESDYSDVPTHFVLFGMTRSLPLVHYTISMPATARLDIDTHNSRVRVSGLRNDVRINSHNGDIEIADLDGAATIETHNGDVRIGYSRFAKSSRVETHNGGIDIGMPAQSRFHVNASGHHLGMSSDFPMSVSSMRDSRYVGDVNGGGPELRISTHNGTLKLRKV
jgi:hypothetical protein